jgi:hypothetical protein
VNLVKLSLALATAFVVSACSLDIIYDTTAIPDKDGSGNGTLYIKPWGGEVFEPIRYTTPPGPFEAHAKLVRDHRYFPGRPTFFPLTILDTDGNIIYANGNGHMEYAFRYLNLRSKPPTVAEADLSATAPAVADVSANQSNGVNPINGITNPLDVIPPSLLDGYVEPDDDDDDDDDD